ARQMITQYGMSDKLGPMTLGEQEHEVFLGRDFSNTPNYSPEIAYEIDKEVRRMVDEGFDKAFKILSERREQLDLMASVLVERETVDKDELEALLNGTWDQQLVKEKAAAAEKKDADDDEASKEPEPAPEPEDTRPIVEVPPIGMGPVTQA
ncbi:MAG: cell division protein FtsH, partial [Actinomycetia bacterium]|nr:cell division protein FtsH [Actinomycetes bacterium]